MSSTPYTNPPAYTDADGPSTVDEALLPDDFKFGTNVASCELSIRQVFIRKVYTLLTLQLLATMGVGLLLNSVESAKGFVQDNSWLLILSFLGALGFMLGSHIMSRLYPYNLVLLAGFTLCEAYTVGVLTTFFDSDTVLNAVVLTAAIFVGLTLFAMQTKYDFTGLQGILFYVLMSMVTFSFFSMFLNFGSTVEYFYSIIGAVVFSVFILVDTQLIMNRFHPEEEVPATITLYLDVINLFLHILSIMSNNNNNDN